jgi:HrpA-like RNA helicase
MLPTQDIARFRPDFRLLIASATLNATKFSDYFDGAPVFRSALLALLSLSAKGGSRRN